MDSEQTLRATKDNVLLKMDLTQKQRYKFSNGQEIYLSRGHEYNLRLDNPNVAEVIHSENIPTGSLCLIHHNAIQDSYRVFGMEGDVFSVPNDLVFLYNVNGSWIPNIGFVISSRIFKPYRGLILNIESEQVKNRMYIYKGLHEGNVCLTLDNCDYQIVYFIEGKEYNIIRTREREIVGIDNELTEAVKKGEYLIGINAKEAKPLNLEYHA